MPDDNGATPGRERRRDIQHYDAASLRVGHDESLSSPSPRGEAPVGDAA
jgi:hypothetical protein